MKNVAIYLRVSTSDQCTSMQRDELLAWCKARNYEITAIYEDIASGGSTDKRPQWNRLMADVQRKNYDMIIVWKLDRWARSLTDLINSLKKLDELGVEFASIRDQVDFSTATGRLMFHILGAFADFELQIISERVKAGIAAAQRRGVQVGKPRRISRHKIHDLRQQGLSLSEIAAKVGATKSGVHKALRRT